MSSRTIRHSLAAAMLIAAATANTGCADVADLDDPNVHGPEISEKIAPWVGIRVTQMLGHFATLGSTVRAYNALKEFIGGGAVDISEESLDAIREIVGEELEVDERDRNIADARALVLDEEDLIRPRHIERYRAECDNDAVATNECRDRHDALQFMRREAGEVHRRARSLLLQMTRDGLADSTKVAYGTTVVRLGATLVLAANEREVAKLAIGPEVHDVDEEAPQDAAREFREALEAIEAAHRAEATADFTPVGAGYVGRPGTRRRRARACFTGPYGRECRSERFRSGPTNAGALARVTAAAERIRNEQIEEHILAHEETVYGEPLSPLYDAIDRIPEASLVIEAPPVDYGRVNFGEQVGLVADHDRWLCAESDLRMVADRESFGDWERFEVRDGDGRASGRELQWGDTISLFTHHGRYVVAEPDGRLDANRERVGSWERFRIVDANDLGRRGPVTCLTTIALETAHGTYVVGRPNGDAEADESRLTEQARLRLFCQ